MVIREGFVVVDGSLSRGQMTALTGIANDVLTFWIRKNLLRAAGSGQGIGNRISFAKEEASLAAIMMQLRPFGSNIETLLAVSSLYREAIDWRTNGECEQHSLGKIEQYKELLKELDGMSGSLDMPKYRYFWQIGPLWHTTKDPRRLFYAHRDGATALLAIDVEKVINRVWHRSPEPSDGVAEQSVASQ